MVHALLQAHSLLNPGGVLVSVHDLSTPHKIEVHATGAIYKVGWLLDKDEFASEHSSFNALAQVVTDGKFILEDERDFRYNIYVDGLPEFQEWLSTWWSSAVISDRIIHRIEDIVRVGTQPSRIVLALQARMTQLRTA